ncbi:MAG: hypothetical protein ACFE8V_08540 [Promethearchaeota archaeon]
MSEMTRKRLPAIRCWIKHLVEAQFSSEKNMLKTIFGYTKRVRILGTIIEKKINVSTQNSNDTRIRIEFGLDDGTSLIQVNKWDANPKFYKIFEKGDLVDIIGLINYKYDNLTISLEVMNKVGNPNMILLRNAEIINKVKVKLIEENEDLDADLSFLEQHVNEKNQVKESVFSVIEKFSQTERGISFRNLMRIMEIPEEKLRRHIRELEIESKIYQSEENFYQSYLP